MKTCATCKEEYKRDRGYRHRDGTCVAASKSATWFSAELERRVAEKSAQIEVQVRKEMQAELSLAQRGA